MGSLRNLLFGLVMSMTGVVSAQDNQLTFSGVVLDHERLEPIVGTTILNQTSGGGAVTDSLGFFSIKASPGDTINFNDVRFVRTSLIVPEVLEGSNYGILQVLINKTLVLDEVSVFSFPTETQFKEAFLKVELKNGLEERKFQSQRSVQNVVRSAYESEKLYYDEWANRRLYDPNKDIPPNYLLDPFKWTQFIQSFKKQTAKD